MANKRIKKKRQQTKAPKPVSARTMRQQYRKRIAMEQEYQEKKALAKKAYQEQKAKFEFKALSRREKIKELYNQTPKSNWYLLDEALQQRRDRYEEEGLEKFDSDIDLESLKALLLYGQLDTQLKKTAAIDQINRSFYLKNPTDEFINSMNDIDQKLDVLRNITGDFNLATAPDWFRQDFYASLIDEMSSLYANQTFNRIEELAFRKGYDINEWEEMEGLMLDAGVGHSLTNFVLLPQTKADWQKVTRYLLNKPDAKD